MRVRGVGGSAGVSRGATIMVPGQLVRGRVLAQIGEGHFLVTIRGYLLNAASNLPLEPGQRLAARVEIQGDHLLLRVQEDETKGDLQEPVLEDEEDIERILRLLGHQPSPLDIREFQERLDRYRPYASLPGLEPSDIWILAILWTRGIRSGADSFALLSYYLRAWRSPSMGKNFCFPKFEDILPLLRDEQRTMQTIKNGGMAENDSLIPGIENRRAEAILLLNREEAILGRYGEITGAGDIGCGLFKASEEPDGHLMRLVDHPILPSFVVELNCRPKRIGLKAFLPTEIMRSPRDEVEYLERVWRDQAKSTEYKMESMDWIETYDLGQMRGAFWRQEAGISLCDRRA